MSSFPPSINLRVKYYGTVMTSENNAIFEEEEKEDNLSFSSYWPKPVSRFFSSLVVEPDLFLLCPVYNDNTVQIGGTGTAKKGETLTQALIRESSEEFSCVPEDLNAVEIIQGNATWLLNSTQYFYNLKEVPISTDTHDLDNRKRKVAFFYWADMNRWKDITFNMTMAKKDNIVGLIALSHSEVFRVIKLLNL